ncbi:MAG: iron ABC transporter [Rickettsiales bacterium]|nr:iron ABC transporter [Rickettsiales bacterium]
MYFLVLIVSLITIIPLITIFKGIIDLNINLEYLNFLREFSLKIYIANSLTILFWVLIFTFCLGVYSAYLVSFYKFPFSNFFKYSLILSFAIPPYIFAYSLSAFFENYGTGYSILSFFFNENLSNKLIPNLNPVIGTIFSLSFSLFGYIYILARLSFVNQSYKLLEVSSNLGFSSIETLYKVIIPSARPAIFVGLCLVAMETLSDFGTVTFFGVSTLITGIYNSWFIFDDLASANILSLFLLIFILFFFCIESLSSKESKYHLSSNSSTKQKELICLKGSKSIYAFSFCSLVFFFSFLFPMFQMSFWAFKFPEHYENLDLVKLNFNTLKVIILTSIIIIFFSFFTNFCIRILKKRSLKLFASLSISGYAIPGILISVSTITFFSMLNELFEINLKSFFIGSIYGLLLGYLFRFYSISFNGIRSGYLKINQSIDESAFLLGFSKLQTLREIHLPFFKKNFFFIFILISLEIIKELPITLILRPFNFDTFSTKAYDYASQDLIEAASVPSIFLIIWTTFLVTLSIKYFLSEEK